MSDDRSEKIGILFFSAICLSLIDLPFIPRSIGSSSLFLPLCFIISEFNYLEYHLREIKQSSIYLFFVIIIILSLFTILISEHLHNPSSIIMFIETNFIRYFALGFSFCAVSDEDDLKTISKYIFLALIISTVFGLINYITRSAVFLNLISYVGNAGDKGYSSIDQMMSLDSRHRVNSTFAYSFDYGFMSIILFFFFCYCRIKNIINKNISTIALSCCIIGIIICGCRTDLFTFLLSVSIFILIGFDTLTTVKLLLFSFIVILLLIINVEPVADRFDELLATFSSTSKEIGGSSIDQRLVNFDAVLYYIKDNYLCGKGFNFFQVDTGYADRAFNGKNDTDLAGMESVVFMYLLERGIIGLILYIFSLLILYKYLLSRIFIDRTLVATAIAILSSYFIFACLTGELGSLYPSMLMLGLFIKLIDSRELFIE